MLQYAPMSTPELSPHQQMANALAGYRRVVAETKIRAEDPDYVQRMWKESEDIVDGLDLFSPDGKMDPAIHKEIIDDLTKLVGGHPPEVGRDMTIPRQALVEQSFRSSMNSEVDESLEATANTLALRKEFADKVGVPATSPNWKTAFYEYLGKVAQATAAGDELSAHRGTQDTNHSSTGQPEGFNGVADVDDDEARFARNCFIVIDGGKTNEP